MSEARVLQGDCEKAKVCGESAKIKSPVQAVMEKIAEQDGWREGKLRMTIQGLGLENMRGIVHLCGKKDIPAYIICGRLIIGAV